MAFIKLNTKAHRIKRSVFVETIINEIQTINFTVEIARLHAELCAHLMEQGRFIGAHDLIIAATASV